MENKTTYERKLGGKAAFFTLLAFYLLNSFKLSIFNLLILSERKPEVILYKVIYTLLVNLVLFSFLPLIRRRIPLILLYFIESVYLFSYMSYYAYYGNYLHLFQAFSLLTEGVGPIKHFTIPVKPEMLILFLDLPILLRIVIRDMRGGSPGAPIKSFTGWMRYSALAVLAALEIWNVSSGIFLLQLNKNFYVTETKIIERYGTFINNISDITVNYGGRNMVNHFAYGESVSASAQVRDNPNIVVIQVEAMDAGIVNQKWGGEYVMPYLHSLTGESIYYPYMLSYHKAGGTSDSEFSILNSIEPLGNYPSMKIPIYDYPNALTRELDKIGYNTMAFHGNIGNYYNRDVAFAKMGFDAFYDTGKMKLPEEGWGVPDHKVFSFALDKMSGDKPFFTYIITMSSHMPFKNVSGYYRNNRYDAVKDELVRDYYAAMSYVDQSIRDFVQDVRKREPNTAVLIWGDHTPGVISDEYTQASYTSGNDYFEYVPFFLLTPDGKAYRETELAASFLDIAPTILYETGASFVYKSDGIDLAAPAGDGGIKGTENSDLRNSGILPKIPFKEKKYDRHELYKRISAQCKAEN